MFPYFQGLSHFNTPSLSFVHVRSILGMDLGNEIKLIFDLFQESLEISPTQLARFLKESFWNRWKILANLVIMALFTKLKKKKVFF